MMRLDELSKSWEVAAAGPIAPGMSFDGDFLVLGARTRLAKAGATLDEARLGALLTAAHGRAITASSLRHVQCALEKKRDGDLVLALVHLALSGVAKLRDSKEDARRLFFADALLSQGVDPAVVGKGMLSIADGALEKYQPRVPAGNSGGGQWTSGDSTARPMIHGRIAPSNNSKSPKPISTKPAKRSSLRIAKRGYCAYFRGSISNAASAKCGRQRRPATLRRRGPASFLNEASTKNKFRGFVLWCPKYLKS